MKKNYLFLCFFIFATIFNSEFLAVNTNSVVTFEQESQPHAMISHEDFLVFYHGHEANVVYQNINSNHPQSNTDTFVTLHFDEPYPVFLIYNNEFYINGFDANWQGPYTASCTVPEGIYNIYTTFLGNVVYFVARYDVNLSSGTNEEIWIDHTEANINVDLDGYDINGNPFNNSMKYYAGYFFHLQDFGFTIGWSHTSDHIFITELSDNFNFYAAELKFDEETIFFTQYGPLDEITSNLVLSNDPAEYTHQSLSLYLPESTEQLVIGIGNTIWAPYENGLNYYQTYFADADMIDCSGECWETELYMMEQLNEEENLSFSMLVGYHYGMDLICHYISSPFHCIDNEVGSFLNLEPISINYLSPDGQSLEFGLSPIFPEVMFNNSGNSYTVSVEQRGYGNETRTYDNYDTMYSITDLSGNIITQGNLTGMPAFNVPDGIYYFTLVNTHESIAGINGTSIYSSRFDSALEHPNPPLFNSIWIADSNVKPTNRLQHNEDASFRFCVADLEISGSTGVYYPVVDDSTKVYFKLHDEENWQECDIVLLEEVPVYNWEFGKVYSADLSQATTTDSSLYDLKVRIVDTDFNYSELILEPAFVVGELPLTGFSQEEINSPNFHEISNYPNPFNPETTIQFNIPKNEIGKLMIYNILGQKVFEQEFSSGEHNFNWNADGLASGIYLYKISSPGYSKSKKMILMK